MVGKIGELYGRPSFKLVDKEGKLIDTFINKQLCIITKKRLEKENEEEYFIELIHYN